MDRARSPRRGRPTKDRPAAVPWPDLGPGQAERLRRFREARGWSQYDLSAAAGVSAMTIRAIEKGGKGASRSDVLAALADALGVSRGLLAYGG